MSGRAAVRRSASAIEERLDHALERTAGNDGDGRCHRRAPDPAPSYCHRHEFELVRRESVLVTLAALEQPVLEESVGDGFSDRVGEQDECGGLVIDGGVTSRLVVALGMSEAESIPRGDRSPVELEEPEPQPALLSGDFGELPMKRFLGTEKSDLVTPAG